MTLFLWAATGTVVPTGDNATDSWTTTPLWEKVDDDIDSPDAAVIVSGNNPSTPSNDILFNITCPSDVGTITEANLRIRAREQGGSARTIAFDVSWSVSVPNNFNTGTLTSSLANYASGNQTGLSISKSACDASTLKVAPTTSGSGPAEKAEIDSVNLDITYTTAANQPPLRRTITLD